MKRERGNISFSAQNNSSLAPFLSYKSFSHDKFIVNVVVVIVVFFVIVVFVVVIVAVDVVVVVVFFKEPVSL